VGLPTEEHPYVGSPHPCARASWHLLLPGDTLFVWVQIPASAMRQAVSKPRFSIEADETCPHAEPCKRAPIFVSEERASER
jgi:hypothetical protein